MATRVERSSMTQTDSRGRVIRAPKLEDNNGLINFKWYLLDEKDMAASVDATIKFIADHQGPRSQQLVTSTRLYGNSSITSPLGSAFTRSASMNGSNPNSSRVSYNLIESCVDTLQAKMSKNEIVPTFVTNGGDWSAQKKAKQLTKFAYGLFYNQKVHKKSVVSFTDAAVWGDGLVHIYEDSENKKACIERVYPHELFVDLIEAISNNPRQMHRVKFIDRDVAFEQFPELEESIAKVAPASYDEIGGTGTAADIICVTESWHLRSGPNATDGVRAICIGEGALCFEYDKDYFPFAHLRYARRQVGYWGQGIAERLQNIQSEINRCMILKQRSLWMQGSFKILIETGSKIVTQHLDNNIATIINYTGTPPQYVTPPATNPELQQWIDALMGYGMSQEGISRMATTGEAPLGVESGKALRTLVQVSDDRFSFMMQDQEAFALEIARQAINIVKDIYKTHGKYEVIFPDKRFIETIDWADINLSEEEFTLRAYPTSQLSDDISGRLSEVQELAQAGMVSPRTARRLLAMPDIEVNDALANAAEDRLHQVFEQMLDDKKSVVYEPGFMDAQMGQQLALQYINYAEYMGAPEDRIQLVRDFLEQINNTQAQAAQAMQPPVAPQANPTPTPTSPLLQNTPQGAAA